MIKDTQWIAVTVMTMAGIVTLSIWSRLAYSAIRHKNGQAAIRSMAVLFSFLVWFAFTLVQNWAFSNYELYSISRYAGYLVLIFALVTLWRVVWLYAGGYLSLILKIRGYRYFFLGSIIVYGVIQLFASGMLQFPGVEERPITDNGFIKVITSYGLLSVWPDVQLWWPAANLAGSVSLDAFAIFVTLTGFMAMSMTLLLYGWRSGSDKKFRMKGIGSTLGSGIAITAISFSCCSFPILYPLFLLFLNSTAATTMSSLIMNQSGILFNLIQMAVLSLMAVTAIFSAGRLGLYFRG
jgi:hypothetical protein